MTNNNSIKVDQNSAIKGSVGKPLEDPNKLKKKEPKPAPRGMIRCKDCGALHSKTEHCPG